MSLTGYTKLVVIGGYNEHFDYLNHTEVINLDNPFSTCSPISQYPVQEAGMTAGLVNGEIKSCGTLLDSDECYNYNPTINSWRPSPNMLYARDTPRSSFIGDIWLISGDDSNGTNDGGNTTEI